MLHQTVGAVVVVVAVLLALGIGGSCADRVALLATSLGLVVQVLSDAGARATGREARDRRRLRG
jgi:hypothetical protein